MNQFEREEQDLHDRYASGELSAAEYNREMRDLHRTWREEVQAAAEEAAEQAYQNELGRW